MKLKPQSDKKKKITMHNYRNLLSDFDIAEKEHVPMKPMIDNYKKILDEYASQFGFMREQREVDAIEKYQMWDIVYENIKYFLIEKLQEERERLHEEIAKYQEKCNEHPMVLPHITKENEKYWNQGYDKALSYVLDKLK